MTGPELRRLRIKYGIRKLDLATLLGTSTKNYTNMENSGYVISEEDKEKLNTYFSSFDNQD